MSGRTGPLIEQDRSKCSCALEKYACCDQAGGGVPQDAEKALVSALGCHACCDRGGELGLG